MEEIINDIIAAFSSLWKIRRRGDSFEIITPVPISNDNFVSVFLTKRGDEYVITDGGWIDAGVYDIDEVSNINFDSIVKHYQSSYGITSLKARELEYFYKKTSSPIFVPNLVFDVSAFIGGIVNSSLAEASRSVDKRYNIFSRKARAFILQNVSEDSIVPSSFLKERFPSLNFGTAIRKGNTISLINFASGSSNYNYINSLCKSKVSFEIVNKEDTDHIFQNKTLLLDDTSKVLRGRKVGVFVELIRNQQICNLTKWSERDVILANAI